MKKTILIVGVVCVCFLFTCLAQEFEKTVKKKSRKPRVNKYPPSYRDHVYFDLSQNGKEMFFGLGPHPLCHEDKEGECIPRGECHGVNHLYLSRVCYKKDLVCCYNLYKVPITIGNITFLPSKGSLRQKRPSEHNATDLGNIGMFKEGKIIDIFGKKVLDNIENVTELNGTEKMNVLSSMNITEMQGIMQNLVDTAFIEIEEDEEANDIIPTSNLTSN